MTYHYRDTPGPSPTLLRVIAAFRARGIEVRQSASNARQFATLCPCHSDTTPSLSIGDGETGVGLHCWAGCEQSDLFDAVVEFTGLTSSDFFYQQTRSQPPEGTPHVTVAELAEAKMLSVGWLAGFGITDGPSGVQIPYFSETGQVTAVRVRHSLRAGFSWRCAPGALKAEVSAYGAWRLPHFRVGGELILVEGETDSITGWAHQLPVIGIPGKASARAAIKNTPTIFNGIDRVFLVEEPDDQVERAFRRGVRRGMTDLGHSVELFVMRLPVKDLSELHITTGGDHMAFMAAFDAAYSDALDFASWPAPAPVGPENVRVATWVTKTAKPTFGVKDCFNAMKRTLKWTEIAEGFHVLEQAGWIRSLPQERRRGRPSLKYRRNPGLQCGWQARPGASQ